MWRENESYSSTQLESSRPVCSRNTKVLYQPERNVVVHKPPTVILLFKNKNKNKTLFVGG